MGTSASHSGPKSGISYDPPWIDDIDIPNVNPELLPTKPIEQKNPDVTPTAPPARFGNARRNMSDYARTGNKDSLQRSLGHYSKTGMGGAKKVADRMQSSSKVATSLFSALNSLRTSDVSSIATVLTRLKNEKADAYTIIDVIVKYVCPDGGSLDEVSSRDSVSSALSDLFGKNPDIDISNLSDDNIWSLMSSFLGYEAFNRIQLDIGQTFEKVDFLGEHVLRLNDMRKYLESEISAQLNSLRTSQNTSLSVLQEILHTSIERTFQVFEETV